MVIKSVLPILKFSRGFPGLSSKVLGKTRNVSEEEGNRFIVFKFVATCMGSLRNGRPSNTHLRIFLNEELGSKIVREPTLVMYKHVYEGELGWLELWLEGGNGNLITDNLGALIGFTSHLKKNA